MTSEERRARATAYVRQWRAANREKALAQGREQAKRWREAHPEEARAQAVARAAKAREKRAKERAEHRLARYLAMGGDKPALTEAQRQLRIWNNAQLLT